MQNMPYPSEDTCQRDASERRNNQLKSFTYSFFKRRRRAMRRNADTHEGHYVDFHDPIFMYIATGIVLLSCMDAIFTLTLLDRGIAVEANPFMKLLIESSTSLFVAFKTTLTAGCILFLVAHRHFWVIRNKVRTHTVLFGALAGYVTLINYELVLLSL